MCDSRGCARVMLMRMLDYGSHVVACIVYLVSYTVTGCETEQLAGRGSPVALAPER